MGDYDVLYVPNEVVLRLGLIVIAYCHLWSPTVTYGHLRSSTVTCGHLRSPMVTYGHIVPHTLFSTPAWRGLEHLRESLSSSEHVEVGT